LLAGLITRPYFATGFHEDNLVEPTRTTIDLSQITGIPVENLEMDGLALTVAMIYTLGDIAF
jgi:hypothetical protein